MDPISLITSVGFIALSAIQTTARGIELARRLRSVEGQKVDILLTRLYMEQKRTKGWASRMRTMGDEAMATLIADEDKEQIAFVLSTLEQHYTAAEERFERAKGAKEHSIEGFAKRMTLAYIGFDELKDLLDALSTLNRFLWEIAPPVPPGYYDHRAIFDNDSLERPPPTTQQSTLSRSRQVESQRPARARVATSARLKPSRSEDLSVEIEIIDLDGEEPQIRLRILHAAVLRHMDVMIHIDSDKAEEASKLRSRLRILATGLFEGPFDIDELLATERRPDHYLASTFRKALVYLLVLEGEALDASIDDNMLTPASERYLVSSLTRVDASYQSHQGNVSQSLRELSDLLGGENLEMSLVYREAATQTSDESQSSFLYPATTIVESLFDLLPTLLTVQQVACLQQEKKVPAHPLAAPSTRTQAYVVIAAPPSKPVTRGEIASPEGTDIKRVLRDFDRQAEELEGPSAQYEPTFTKALDSRQKRVETTKEAKRSEADEQLTKMIGTSANPAALR